MRILLLTDSYLPRRGGSRVVYHEICARLGGDTARVVTRTMPGDDTFDRGAGYQIARVRIPGGRFCERIGLAECACVIPLLARGLSVARRWRPDVIQCGEALASGLSGSILARSIGVPCIVWLHDNALGPRSRVRHPLRRRIITGAGGIIAACRFARDEALRCGVRDKRVALIRPGVDAGFFAPPDSREQARERLNIKGKKVLLTISRILPQKGQDTVIRALPRLVREHPDLVYLIAGEGPYRGQLERLASELNVAERVVFLGPVPQEELPRYYGACDLFIMLNREVGGVSWEGLGIVFLEASACGAPVIGGKSGGTADSVVHGQTGFLVAPEDESEVASTVGLLLGDPALARRMGEAGRERVVREFSWERSAREVRAFCEQVCAWRRGGRCG
ncbi:MAG: glycosyltransferase family 4 protein [Candidatus Aureabacteria bacterium]|nr:glycosyltransferase family 4 protein [Candidatus Auribacterota bacterium]